MLISPLLAIFSKSPLGKPPFFLPSPIKMWLFMNLPQFRAHSPVLENLGRLL